MGPILAFDKSMLQSLNINESVWLENFFLTNIVPIFFVETLADLEKRVKEGRRPEEVVGSLASKTPAFGSYPNVHHIDLIAAELLYGEQIEMDGHRPIIAGGNPVSVPGKKGIVFERSREAVAFERWQQGEFLELEREVARSWREGLSILDHTKGLHLIEKVLNKDAPRDLPETKNLVIKILQHGDQESLLRTGMELTDIPGEAQVKVLTRWHATGSRNIQEFAPYFAHVLSIDLFFYKAVARGFISGARASNKIDIAYLYYLPFCMLFSSKDKLHRQVVPLFLKDDQMFIWAEDLKQGLGELDRHYSKFPEDMKEEGVMRFAPYPPTEGDFIVSNIWDKMCPDWRKQLDGGGGKERKLEGDRRLIKEVEKMMERGIRLEETRTVSSDEADYVGFKRQVPVRKGKWRLIPEGPG